MREERVGNITGNGGTHVAEVKKGHIHSLLLIAYKLSRANKKGQDESTACPSREKIMYKPPGIQQSSLPSDSGRLRCKSHVQHHPAGAYSNMSLLPEVAQHVIQGRAAKIRTKKSKRYGKEINCGENSRWS